MKLPQIVEQTLPFALLIASMMAFTRLNRRSELSIIRASGISAWRFLTPVMILGVVLGLFTMMVLNPFAAKLTESFEQTRDRLLNEGRPTLAVSDTGIDRDGYAGNIAKTYRTGQGRRKCLKGGQLPRRVRVDITTGQHVPSDRKTAQIQESEPEREEHHSCE